MTGGINEDKIPRVSLQETQEPIGYHLLPKSLGAQNERNKQYMGHSTRSDREKNQICSRSPPISTKFGQMGCLGLS